MKIATVKISWTRSPSADVTSRMIEINKNGEVTALDLPPEVGEYVLDVEAGGAVSVKTTVFDSEGNEATSDTYSFVLGDLTAPVPDSNFSHEILAVRVEVETPVETPVE